MNTEQSFSLRPAHRADGLAVFEVTRFSVRALAKNHYSPEQIDGWMGNRTAEYYEDLIAKGRMVVAEQAGRIVGFVDSEPGEVTRLFLLEEAAGSGLGKRLLEIGIDHARLGHEGPIKVESTINAEGFYQRHGFRTLKRGFFSHGVGGDPIEIVHMEL
ncbi:GNAT family N-acetyltransferase [Pseudaminobacter soli (ex Li et al. 2025)]|uniref:GNAT family N-acetyltransferase n=1 Tax=Pseudaminobacter soli (ex Li et al. 2025) TaxID=1295366 RepID=A0A2P7SC97_9HYPH|nr:GNAT family N-acetyltransferase [Mesorhizobium soli]PSJ59945.1 GNAT family N-acetyltransferase [Mesorhizobium soli]